MTRITKKSLVKKEPSREYKVGDSAIYKHSVYTIDQITNDVALLRNKSDDLCLAPLNELSHKSEYWVTQEGQVIHPSCMDVVHIVAALDFLKNNNPYSNFVNVFKDELEKRRQNALTELMLREKIRELKAKLRKRK